MSMCITKPKSNRKGNMNINPKIGCKKEFNAVVIKLIIFAVICGALYWYASVQFNDLVEASKPSVQTLKE